MHKTKNSNLSPYQYVSRRVDGNVRRRYLGRLSKPTVALLARTRRLRRTERRQMLSKRHKQKKTAGELNEAMHRMMHICKSWRWLDSVYDHGTRRYRRSIDRLLAGLRTLRPRRKPVEYPVLTGIEIKKLFADAHQGNEEAIHKLRMLRADAPHVLAELVQLTSVAREQVLSVLSSESPASIEFAKAKIDDVVRQLFDATREDPVGRLYSEIVAVAWMAALVASVNSTAESMSKVEQKFWQTQADRALRRFHEGIKFLERRRRRRDASQRTTSVSNGPPRTRNAKNKFEPGQ